METLENLFELNCRASSDIHLHLPRLCELASQCNHITEFGTRHGLSTLAFLYAQPKTLICYDIIKQPDIDILASLKGDTDFKFILADDLTVEIEDTDLLFIDTVHTYNQLKHELNLHAGKVRQFIVMHDTTQNVSIGEDGGEGLLKVIDEFLQEGTFVFCASYDDCCGLTVLTRRTM